MFNLKIGDAVMHLGEKRTITYIRQFCGTQMYHLSRYVPMVVRYQFKPILTVRNGVIIAGPRG